MRLFRILPAVSILATLLFATPVNAAATTASISINDLAHFNPATFNFPGASAFSFHPGVATVSQGGTVTWTNNGYDQHTVTSYTVKTTFSFEGVNVQLPVPDGHFDSLNATGPIQSGQSWTLDTGAAKLSPGDYLYFCQFHPWMQALLHVVSDTSHPTASVNIDHHQGSTGQFFSGSASWGFLPRDLQVKKGTQVTVTNNGILPHTFSSYTVTIPVTEGFKTLIIPVSNGVFNQTLFPTQSWTLDTGTLNTGTYTYACLFHPWMKGSLTVS
jgi:plastocyanin